MSAQVEAVRRFNRFYTKKIGVLQEGLLESEFSLTQVRILYELAHGSGVTASRLVQDLDLDAGYVSRVLANFQKRGWVVRKRSKSDARQFELRLTRSGLAIFRPLEARSSEQVERLLEELAPMARGKLLNAMTTIETLLGDMEPKVSYLLRPHRPGDIGWVISRHGALYSQEYGWDETFEALVAEIAAHFIRNFDPKREQCWIAERNEENVGSVFLVQESETVAKLRLLLIEPSARGLGIGHRLVAECIRFARQAGYGKITLWTNDILNAARRIYEKAGFVLVHEEPHHSFGKDLVGQTWELKLD